ncbi:UDP-N-acetylmuramoyl-L-alanine--D-glutamate ligase [Gynuella sunshinyii]|uniref:UDP-N-acetylmuramoylalanine--D-glutamate ligase n=1 Tax=Gynuella sunshinyii YC6258 TaxID=1445510 RepID=A0A0C5VVE7_9GAMM|nr:UDP-N-acetylmuramoyl-L-alanine--D-glutamate ligase [Gynuella sunshinyii]AJQ94429.1 UDP-N-acetylmuramoylalanine-D-glutamate ligase [Gynuella sunshinyii YC6258]
MEQQLNSKKYAVVGLGMTGLSAARYLLSKKQSVLIMDTRINPPGLNEITEQYPNVRVLTGALDRELLTEVDEIILSPGLSVHLPEIQHAIENGAQVSGDIDLFLEQLENTQTQIIAITGSNGKSTVTALLGEMARAASPRTAVCGNIGVPVLDFVDQDLDFVILELSSFQLETLNRMSGHIATILNISEDHMDRYDSLEDYVRAKQRIFVGSRAAVVNLDDNCTTSGQNLPPLCIGYSLELSGKNGFSLQAIEDGHKAILFNNHETWVNSSQLKLKGSHNLANFMAAFALGQLAGIHKDIMIDVACNFTGLDHRCEWVAERNGIVFINDSKGTNVGATIAALAGLGDESLKHIVLIAGGIGKGADFSKLGKTIQRFCRKVILIGQDAELIAVHLKSVEHVFADTLQNAVERACEGAKSGDLVLLSPACASMDMFKSFEDRGNQFKRIVGELR